MRDLPGSELNRCILRDEMIDAIIRAGLDDEADFLERVPQHLRIRTDGRQKRYLKDICDIVADCQRGDAPPDVEEGVAGAA